MYLYSGVYVCTLAHNSDYMYGESVCTYIWGCMYTSTESSMNVRWVDVPIVECACTLVHNSDYMYSESAFTLIRGVCTLVLSQTCMYAESMYL